MNLKPNIQSAAILKLNDAKLGKKYLHKKELSDKHLPIQSQLKKHWKKVWIIFKVNNKNTRTTFYCVYW